MFKPKYRISSSILNNIARISEIKTLIERSRVLPDREALLRRKAVVKMAHTSTSIEGNPLAEYEVKKVLEGEKIDAAQKEILEVKNYQEALLLVNQLAAAKAKITKKVVLDLHKSVLAGLVEKEKVGKFRKTQVYIVNEYKDHDEVAYQPPGAKRVPGLVGELLDWVEKVFAKKENPIIASGLFHYQFETIHPFADGNGRVGRLLTQLYLYLSGYDFRKILVLEEFYNENRKAYYEALQTGENYSQRKGADLTDWLRFFTDGFLAEAEKARLKIEELGFGKTVGDGEQIYLDRDEIKIMDFINTIGKLTSGDVCEILKISKRAAQFKIKDLLKKGLVKKKGDGPATFYVLKN